MNLTVRWLHRIGKALRDAQEWLSRGLHGPSERRTPLLEGPGLREDFEARKSPPSNSDTQPNETDK